ncbi:centrosomal protein of 112 kDa-like isoform X1 [Huso huso]|uniref:Centrosomal protein of 112 kDa-like isoform X1 n=1 Tax=Huso huso TaxID=61971 RepID=A0ABR0YZY2_HUSHU
MSSQEQTWEKLDSEFDHYLVDIKPYVLKLPHKSERQRCALWIKKLCEPSGSGTGVMGRKNRNMYARLLLHMLRRGALEGPFTHRPEPGTLKTLPTYMSIYFDEPLSARPLDQSSERLPDWVTGELGSRDSKVDDSWRLTPREDGTLTSSPRPAHRRRHTYNEKLASQARSNILTHRSDEKNHVAEQANDGQRRLETSLDDSDLEARLNSWNLGIENPRYLRENPIPLSPISLKTSLGKNSTCYDDQTPVHMHEKEVEMKAQVLEARCHEEKLKLQQKHDADVQKILDRKNNEIEELKNLYRTKQKESEEAIRKLDKKVQSLVRESQVIRESKENQITELKKMADQSADSLKNEWEKKLHNVVTEMEQEKFKLQKKHTENIQELLEDTNSRLSKMEAEYSAQAKATNQMVRELEARVQQLTVEAENSNLQRQKVTQEKAELEHHNTIISTELHEARIKYNALQREKGKLIEEHEQNIRQITASHDSDLVYFKQEHALSAAKAADVVDDLEQAVSQLKKQLQESEHKRQHQLREQDSRFQLEKSDIEHLNEKKLRSLQSGAQRDQAEAKKKMDILEDVVREKEEQLARLTELQKIQAQQAEGALEQFKRQVALNSEMVYSEMKQQMEKVEADLSRSKSLREKQSEEFSWQLQELKQRYEQQIVELKLEHEQEKTHLFQQHNAEKDSLVQDHELEIGNLEKQLRAAMEQHDTQTQEWRKRDSQTIAELESQVHCLREELNKLDAQRKLQLLELGLLREEEKRKAAQEHQDAIGKLQAEMDRIRPELQSVHTSEMELAAEQTNIRLKQIEKEYSQKLAKSSQTIADLQSTVSSLREEAGRQQLSAERHLQERLGKVQEEKRSLTREHDKTNKALQDKIENFQNQVRSVEKKLQNKELESQEQITHIRQECELKIKGLMPAALRQELEDTITSLKSQVVNFLQKRASVLQEELGAYRSRR